MTDRKDIEIVQTADSAKAFAAHGPEWSRLYAYMRVLGNKSQMALDPDLDLFYLGFPLANNTPSTAGIIVRIAAYATLNVPRGGCVAERFARRRPSPDDPIDGIVAVLRHARLDIPPC